MKKGRNRVRKVIFFSYSFLLAYRDHVNWIHPWQFSFTRIAEPSLRCFQAVILIALLFVYLSCCPSIWCSGNYLSVYLIIHPQACFCLCVFISLPLPISLCSSLLLCLIITVQLSAAAVGSWSGDLMESCVSGVHADFTRLCSELDMKTLQPRNLFKLTSEKSTPSLCWSTFLFSPDLNLKGRHSFSGRRLYISAFQSSKATFKIKTW